MARGKLKRFAENMSRHNVIEKGKPLFETVKGNWNKHFQNEQPITLELACGKGEYTIGLARKFPERNFIGIDIKGDRIWKGAGIALEEGLDNVAFLRTHLLELEHFFENGEVNEIWITFPDPRPKDRDEKRRVTHTRYFDLYKKILNRNGWLRLKTDNTGLFDYSLEVLKTRKDIADLEYTYDLYHSEFRAECHEIRTKYEEKFSAEGHDIKYLKFRFLSSKRT
ncbi:MAG: tRNA (guanosine(46)-N7)-methyltransferase TrmB [Bacteroidota bacterium]